MIKYRWISVATIVASCAACAGDPVRPQMPVKSRFDVLLDKTAALVHVDEDGVGAYCAAVWVSPTKLLTAAHCVETDATVLVMVRGYSEICLGLVARTDKRSDLALVEVPAAPEHHAVAQIALVPTLVGDPIDVVGHPIGHVWSWVPGHVSGSRWLDIGTLTGESPAGGSNWTQIAAPIAPGNSGGPVFNTRGQVVGITSFSSPRYPGAGFTAELSEIREFLK